MKIGIVSFGHTDVVLPLYKNLRNNENEIDLIFCFALNRKSESVLNFEDKTVVTGFLPPIKKKEILSGDIMNYLGDISSVHFFIYYNLKLRSVRNFLLSIKLANRLKHYYIIHFNGTNGVLPFLIFLLRKKKLVFTIHDVLPHSGEKTRFGFAEKINEYIIKSKYPVIVQNRSDHAFLKKKYSSIAEKFKFIPFGILDIYREFKDAGQKVISSDLLFFGRISPYKGIEYLIEAVKQLNSKGLKIKTVIAGNGQIYFNADELDSLGITLINRHVPNQELVSLIENTKIVVCPYTDATQSGVVMTAFAFQKPVIASSVGGFKDVIVDGYNGMLIPPRNGKALAEAIQILMKDDNKRNEISRNIKKAEHTDKVFSWQQIVNQIIWIYKNNL